MPSTWGYAKGPVCDDWVVADDDVKVNFIEASF